ncbi:hypothetical protein H0H81_003092 [Sphagnurus paluster]|uniref:Subtilisin n=1 Tax=Sphagnurus paluster TaxID=117069 RepID=A0A9P7FVB3_9AGAR|nr:hypothetical protein H0H81_003092 [Sphagnurus paluster]
MRFLSSFFATFALAAPIFASPVLVHTVQKFDGKTTGDYIVKLKDGVSTADVISQLKGARITYSDWTIMNGFSGPLDDVAITILRTSPLVEYIVEDGFMNAFGTQTQNNAPWGLARLSQSSRLTSQNTNSLSFSYTYDDSAGSGVDIYILDTGARTTHTQFGGRARRGPTFGGYSGIAAASQFGVAKAANIISVKVLGDDG